MVGPSQSRESPVFRELVEPLGHPLTGPPAVAEEDRAAVLDNEIENPRVDGAPDSGPVRGQAGQGPVVEGAHDLGVGPSVHHQHRAALPESWGVQDPRTREVSSAEGVEVRQEGVAAPQTEFRLGRLLHVFDRDNNLNVHRWRSRRVDDGDGTIASQKPCHLVERTLGRGQADALGLSGTARCEALQRQSQVRSPL